MANEESQCGTLTSSQPFRIISLDGGGVHAASHLPLIGDLEQHIETTIASSSAFQMLVDTSTGALGGGGGNICRGGRRRKSTTFTNGALQGRILRLLITLRHDYSKPS